ncbi:hypothetical protein C8R46DRAFT_1104520 [Mycena filopes]|nr:hypothetical protein C8R46DRAFT_1104520 [Mycena filopes]
MPRLKGILSTFTSYRLGYTSLRPYPWRWATPSILCIFSVISVFLAFLNVPLSAYDIIQESTYHPNDTLPPLLFSTLVPGLLQSPEVTFTPHVLSVGDTITANNSMINYTIAEAWDDSGQVASFSYYNNPFSDGCDIVNMTYECDFRSSMDGSVSVEVVCHIPTLFRMTWALSTFQIDYPRRIDDPALLFELLLIQLMDTLSQAAVALHMSNLKVVVQPACYVDGVLQASSTLPTEIPCNTQPARLVGLYMAILALPTDFFLGPSNSTNLFENPLLAHVPDPQPGPLPSRRITDMNTPIQNMFQSLYHLARMQLGVIVPNQIFSSPAMFNESILPSDDTDGAEMSRAFAFNATTMAEWAGIVQTFNATDRVPVINYLRPIPRLKPLGSAMTSVFVSTFAMVSVLWTIFSLVAGALAARAENGSARNVSSIEDRLDTYGVAIARMDLSLSLIQRALKRRGSLDMDNNSEDGMLDLSISLPSQGAQEEKSSLLLHRNLRQSDLSSSV